MPSFVRLLAVLGGTFVLATEVALTTTSLRGQSSVPTIAELEGELLALLHVADGVESGDLLLTRRLDRIEMSLSMTYQSLPKNYYGRLASRSVHYLVHSYFRKEHGWLIRGLEPKGFQLNMSEAHSAPVLKDQVPAVLQELLESRHAHHGLSLGDVVAMVALMEHLVLGQSVDMLRTAYEFMNVSAEDLVSKEMVHGLLLSFLIVIRRPALDKEEHDAWLEDFRASNLDVSNFVSKALEFEQALFNNTAFDQRSRSNPFEEKRYSFEATSRFAHNLMNQYGQFQHEECSTMKSSLMSLDPSGEGLVPLGRFYLATDEFGFWESSEYLREVGALDESIPGNLRVRIANYVLGPSNCIANNHYYSVCCLDECKAIQSELESAVQAPHSTPERLLRLVGGIPSPSVEVPRELNADLRAKLHGIADHHGGQVPLHGRLFTQWLHFAFPNECPYPHVTSHVNASQVFHWGGDRHIVSAVEAMRHVGAAEDAAAKTSSVSAAVAQWTDDEVLPLMESPRPAHRSTLNTLSRGVALFGLLVVVLRLALGRWASARVVRDSADDKKAVSVALPTHFC